MERVRRLVRLWSWLPAFRAVAETEHLHGASELLHLTPSTLSRAIRLLEDDLGRPLFDRVGRNIVLNGAGHELLAALRDAMRLVDDGVERVTGRALCGPVHIVAAGELVLPFIAPALDRLRELHPELLPHVHPEPPTDLEAELLRGSIDVAFVYRARSQRGLTVDRIGALPSGIYCGDGHPLFAHPNPSLREALAHPFVAPLGPDGHGTADRWPAEHARTVALYLAEVHQAFEVCSAGRLLAVLPDFLPSVLCSVTRMRRLPIEIAPPNPLYAVTRAALVPTGAAQVVVQAVRVAVERTRAAP